MAPPTTSDDQLAAASVHYHAGRYGEAAAAFLSIADASATPSTSNSAEPPTSLGGEDGTTSNSSRKRKIDQCSNDCKGSSMTHGSNRIFDALPSLSAQADAALSAARSALAGRKSSKGSAGDDGTSIVRQVKAALDANATYRTALLSASMVLRRLRLGCKNNNDDSKGNGNQYQRQVAVSFLMAGTSASWLHMAIGDGPSAQNVLIHSLRGAASCFFEDKSAGSGGDVLPPAMLPMTNTEAWLIVQSGLVGDNNSGNDDTNEKERCQIAFRTFCNATRVSNLGDGASTSIPIPTNGSKTDHNVGDENFGDASKMLGGDGMRRQELLITALTLHRSLKSLEDETMRTTKSQKRDALLKEAVSMESHLGPARRVQILLDGMKLLSSPTETEDSTVSSASDTITGLKALASSSRMARAMLGCIYASRGQHALALSAWQKTLKINGDDSGSSEYQATVLGMTNCFVMLGEATPAEELLLHLNTTKAPVSTSDGSINGTPLKISLGDSNSARSSQKGMMWRIYFVSTLAEDWVTCLAAAENLVDTTDGTDSLYNDLPCARAALIFSLLQCHRHSDALDKYVEWSNDDVGGSLGALLSLYEADALISLEGEGDKGRKIKIDGTDISAVHEKCRSAIDKLFESEVYEDDLVDDDDICSDVLLDIATDNNQGISFILEGNTRAALLAFEDASKARLDSDLLLLRPRFNLSLLLFSEGHRSEATRVWMGTRNLEASNLRGKMEEAISRHALYCAAKKRSTPGDALEVATEKAKITPWSSGDVQSIGRTAKGSYLSGTDLEQVLAFDVAVLQHAVTEKSLLANK